MAGQNLKTYLANVLKSKISSGIILSLFLLGCTDAHTSVKKIENADASGKFEYTDIYIKLKKNSVKQYYMRYCLASCYSQIQSPSDARICVDKCKKDLEQIFEVMDDALKNNRESDFDDMLEDWYR